MPLHVGFVRCNVKLIAILSVLTNDAMLAGRIRENTYEKQRLTFLSSASLLFTTTSDVVAARPLTSWPHGGQLDRVVVV